MRLTSDVVIRACGLAAVVGGLMFVVIQPLHPADVLDSVRSPAWANIHYATLVMLSLFLVGIVGIYARQVERVGWLGLAGLVVLSVGLLLTAAGAVIEVFVEPLLADSNPAFVGGMMGMVEGHPTGADLGAIPTVWSLSSAAFLIGTLAFGIASWRANVVSRWASLLFAFGLFLSAPVVGLLGLPRLAAVPIGLGLAWLGYSVWSEGRAPIARRVSDETVSEPDAQAAV